MATTLSHFPQPSSSSNSCLPLSDAEVIMAETTMAPVDLAPAERSMPVGYRFNPTDQELVGHYLRHKLKADDLSIDDIIPEIGVCKCEPWDLLASAASASATKFDESQCFFFSPRDYKYSNSTRSNRATSRGFWKITGRDRKITNQDTNRVIGTKKTLVYHEGRVPRGVKTNWVIHEYHDAQLSHEERTHVLCWLKKNEEKDTKRKRHQSIDNEREIINHVMLDCENQAHMHRDSEGHYFSNRSPMIQVSSQSNEVIESTTQIPIESDENISSMIQVHFQSDEVLTSNIHTPLSESNSTVPVDSLIQISIKPIQSDETSTYNILPSESNSVVETPLGVGQLGLSLFDLDESEDDFISLWQSFLQSPEMDGQYLLQSPRTVEQGAIQNDGNI